MKEGDEGLESREVTVRTLNKGVDSQNPIWENFSGDLFLIFKYLKFPYYSF